MTDLQAHTAANVLVQAEALSSAGPRVIKQRSIAQAVEAVGIGVHSGQKVRMRLRPAEEHTGVVFVRVDREHTVVHARTQQVSDTTLSTTLSENGVSVSTVEHLLSALWGLGVDNVVVELDSEEVPAMDGSAAPFIYLIRSAGIAEQRAPKEFIRIVRPVRVQHGDSTASLTPWSGFRAEYTFVADHPVYNRYPKHVCFDVADSSYADEMGRARSFGLINELDQARAIQRCLGSSLDNAVGVGDYRILNPEGLRFDDEFVQHKVLDAIGDLYLLGRPLLGCFSGYKSGHMLNNLLAKELLTAEDAWEVVPAAAGERPLEPILAAAATAAE